MADRPPPGFLNVQEAERKSDQQQYDVIGMCIDYLKPAKSRGTDFMMKLQLWDASCRGSGSLDSNGLTIRCFYKDEWMFPPIQEIGDILIIRSLKPSSMGSHRFGMTCYSTSWTVLSASSLRDSTDPQLHDVAIRKPQSPHAGAPNMESVRPDLAVLQYAKSLVESKDLSTLRGPPGGTALTAVTITSENGGNPSPRRQKFCEVKDIRSPYESSGYQFVDLVGEIRRVWEGVGNPVEVQLTDYTEHDLLFDYPEEDGAEQKRTWVGPWGQRTITINAWDQHGQYIMEMVRHTKIERGTYVRVNNVQIKMDKRGTLMQGHLRGGGSNTGTSVIIHTAKDAEHMSELKDLIVRKRAYNVGLKAKAIGFDTGTPIEKRPVSPEPQGPTEQKKKKSKAAKRKAKEKARLLESKTTEQLSSNGDVLASRPNQHVRCEAVNIPATTVTMILQGETLDRVTPEGNRYRLPFQNCRYKSRLQVVDFFPDSLEDFAVPYRISDYEALSDYDSADDEETSAEYARQNAHNVRWKWHFVLLVADPRSANKSTNEQSMMLLQVSGKDGDYLLNMEACDLKQESRELAKLKEKMFVLWGDLEEKKTENGKSGLELRDDGETVSSKPFECLIKEYGVESRTARGRTVENCWERMFAMFGTNVG